jgi:hypothetical protein
MPLSGASYSPLGWNDGDGKRSRPQTLLYNFQFLWKEILLLILATSTTLLSIAVFDHRSQPRSLTTEHSMRPDSEMLRWLISSTFSRYLLDSILMVVEIQLT